MDTFLYIVIFTIKVIISGGLIVVISAVLLLTSIAETNTEAERKINILVFLIIIGLIDYGIICLFF